MQSVIGIGLVLSGPFPLLGAEDDSAKARQVIERAWVAHGGVDRIQTLRCATWNEKGTYYGMGNGVPYIGEYASQAPNRFKMKIERAFTIVVDGNQGWLKTGESTREMNPDELAEQMEMLHASSVVTLAPLNDPAYQFTAAGEAVLNGANAVGVKVSRQGKRDVTLWFGRESHLLLKSANIVKSPEMKNKEVLEEVYFEQMQNVSGVLVPRKVTIFRDQTKFVEASMENYQLAEKIDNSHFAKP